LIAIVILILVVLILVVLILVVLVLIVLVLVVLVVVLVLIVVLHFLCSPFCNADLLWVGLQEKYATKKANYTREPSG